MKVEIEFDELTKFIEDVEEEIEWLRADKEAISQTASDYLHEIERLKADGLRAAMKRLAAWIPSGARAPLKLP